MQEVSTGQNLNLTSYLTTRLVALQCFWRNDKHRRAKINVTSGFLLSKSCLITAAHNLFVKQLGLASDVRIIFQDDDNQKVSSKCISLLVKLQTSNCFLKLDQNGDIAYDLALIRLKRIQQMQKILVFTGFQQSYVHNQKIIVSGFPDYKLINKQDSTEHPKVLSAVETQRGVLHKIKNNLIYYKNVHTVFGQSGGPVMIMRANNVYLIGIHVQYNQVEKIGKGVLISQTVWQIMVAWGMQLQIDLLQLCSVISHVPLQGDRQPAIQSEQANSQIDSKPFSGTNQSSLKITLEKISELIQTLKEEIVAMEVLVAQMNRKMHGMRNFEIQSPKNQPELLQIYRQFKQRWSKCEQTFKDAALNETIQNSLSSFAHKGKYQKSFSKDGQEQLNILIQTVQQAVFNDQDEQFNLTYQNYLRQVKDYLEELRCNNYDLVAQN